MRSKIFLGPIQNDILKTINSLVIVIFVRIFDKIVYPLLRKCDIKLNATVRITYGFIIAPFGMVWSALVQHLIYLIAPNFLYASTPCSTCQKFNNITVAWQISSYFFLGIAKKSFWKYSQSVSRLGNH
jgi:POT family proton-dependent oligopeptide transporter